VTEGHVHNGACHCGAVTASFRTSLTSVPVRACQCGFCRRHGSKTVTDTDGFVDIASDGPLRRYRFGLMTADYLMCASCGTYVASEIETDGIMRVTLNAAGLQMQPWADQVAEPADYSTETLHERLDRRRARWTPARVRERALA
jgi:hypothetical protein